MKRIVVYRDIGNSEDPQILAFSDYAVNNTDWELTLIQKKQDLYDNKSIKNVRTYNGGCGDVGRYDIANIINQSKTPFVNLYGGTPFFKIPQIGVNNWEIGELAADYFVKRGFREFGFVGFNAGGLSVGRGDGYYNRLSAYGYKAHMYDRKKKNPKVKTPTYMEWNSNMYSWFEKLPKPIAIFTVKDNVAIQVINISKILGLKIPEDVAILGAENDEFICRFSNPTISSIELPLKKIGYNAARLLDSILSNSKVSSEPIYYSPIRVVERKTTDYLYTENKIVLKAYEFMKNNFQNKLTTQEVASHCGVAVKTLERNFKNEFHISPFKKIRELQINEIKRMLKETDMTLDAIAEYTGFSLGIRLSVEFKKNTGITPGNYRKQFRT